MKKNDAYYLGSPNSEDIVASSILRFPTLQPQEEWEEKIVAILDGVFIHGRDTPNYSLQSELPKGQLTEAEACKLLMALLADYNREMVKKLEGVKKIKCECKCHYTNVFAYFFRKTEKHCKKCRKEMRYK